MEDSVINSAAEAAEVLQGIEAILSDENIVFSNYPEVWPIIVAVRVLRQWVDSIYDNT